MQFRVAALQLAAQALSVNASRIWAEVFDPELDTGVSVLKSLERERAVFDSLEAGLREEITGVLTETGEASPTRYHTYISNRLKSI